jgi:pimeloyl-ACP methyl ester carboxylesterase
MKCQLFTLPGGRNISYAEFGDPGGSPVFWFHGAPSSYFEPLLIGEDVFKQYGMRVIAINRPGMGKSVFVKGRGFTDGAGDVAALADYLSLDIFSVLGFSGGSAYVSACAAKIPARIKKAVIVSGGWQMNLPDARRKLTMPYSIFWTVADKLPFLLPFMIKMMKESPKKNKPAPEPNKMLHPADFKALMQHDREAVLSSVINECLLQGTRGAVYDVRLYVKPWDFNIRDIRLPVIMFHGEEDRNAPLAMIQSLISRYPAATLQAFTGEAHFSTLLNHFDSIARTLVL